MPEDRFVLQFEGASGAEYHVEVSTDLRQWTELGLATQSVPGSGPFTFADTNVAARAAQFYRVRSP